MLESLWSAVLYFVEQILNKNKSGTDKLSSEIIRHVQHTSQPYWIFSLRYTSSSSLCVSFDSEKNVLKNSILLKAPTRRIMVGKPARIFVIKNEMKYPTINGIDSPNISSSSGKSMLGERDQGCCINCWEGNYVKSHCHLLISASYDILTCWIFFLCESMNVYIEQSAHHKWGHATDAQEIHMITIHSRSNTSASAFHTEPAVTVI